MRPEFVRDRGRTVLSKVNLPADYKFATVKVTNPMMFAIKYARSAVAAKKKKKKKAAAAGGKTTAAAASRYGARRTAGVAVSSSDDRCTVGGVRYHTPFGPIFKPRFLHSRKGGGAESVGVGAVSPRAFREMYRFISTASSSSWR